jgi:hypothetical protein
LQHPDLTHLARRLRDRLDETLEAEQHAAQAAARRRSSLRDHLLEAEDRHAVGVVSASDGQLYRGQVRSVGSDHVVLADDATTWVIAIEHIAAFEVR